MIKPTIHINGTDGRELFDAFIEARSHLKAAREIIPCPNARDYVPTQSPEAYGQARDEHFDRLKRIDALVSELEELAGHCEPEPKAEQISDWTSQGLCPVCHVKITVTNEAADDEQGRCVNCVSPTR